MPGEERDSVSTILIKERFVVGFGGWHGDDVDEMRIFDLRTHKVSSMKKDGEWHPGGRWPVLAVRDEEVYVIGGERTTAVHCLSFSALSQLIEQGGVRSAFCFCLGFPIQPGKGFERRILGHYIPLCL